MEGPTTPGNNSGWSRPWRQLPTAVQTQILSLLPSNDRALSGRLVSPDARNGLSGPQHCTASLSQPLPPHAAPWAVEAGQPHVRQLRFRHKLQLLCAAAASGSEANLEVALALLQPSTFSGHLHSWVGPDPGVAAVEAGHPQLLGWLVRHCPNLMLPGEVLAAAARHCSLAGLQAAWEALHAHPRFRASISSQRMVSDTLEAAAESVTPDAIAKMEWLLATAGSSGCTGHGTAQAAARSGDAARLRWLQDRGCPVGEWAVLLYALEHADLAVAQWLVDEAGCRLPAAGGGDNEAQEANWGGMLEAGGGDIPAEQRDRAWTRPLQAAAKSSDAVAKWQWLQERGGPSVTGAEGGMVEELALAAVRAGQVEAVQYLLSVLGAGKVLAVGREALSYAAGRSGSIPVAECLQQAGLLLSHEAYGGAVGKLPLIRWLALQARVSAAGYTCRELQSLVLNWPRATPAHSRDLLEAVQLLAGAGFSDWGGTRLTEVAAGRGELDLVLFLVEQGAPLNPDMGTVADAAEAGCEPLIELLTAQPDCFKPSAMPSYTPYICAAVNGDRATLDALRRLGVPWGGECEVVWAVIDGCGEPALRWLVEHGAPVGGAEDMEEAVAGAVAGGALGAEAAAWLRGLAAGGSGGQS